MMGMHHAKLMMVNLKSKPSQMLRIVTVEMIRTNFPNGVINIIY